MDVQRKSVHVDGVKWDKCLRQLDAKGKSVDGATGDCEENLQKKVEGSRGQKMKLSMRKDGVLSKHEQLDGGVMDGSGGVVSSKLPRRTVSTVREWPMHCGPNE